MNTINLLLFDFALAMWVRNATPKMAGDMSSGGHSLQAQFMIFRRAYTFFMKTKVLPYLVLPGPVEIDEAKIGRQRWHFRGEFPKKIKWAFGMFCRTTQIPVIYEIKCKVHAYLVSILKRHLRAGTVMHSDHHSSYVVLRSAKSLLAKYGFYHYWVNHSNLYVHEKFSFVMTGNIERVWSQLRHMMMPLKFQRNSKRIEEYLCTYMLQQMIKNKQRESWTLKMLRDFYKHQYYIYIKLRNAEEDRVPGLRSIEEANSRLEELGMFFRDYEAEYHAKSLHHLTLFKNEDLDDVVKPLTTQDIDPSIQNLRYDPHKHIFMTHKSRDDIVMHLDPREDKILRLQYIKFYEEDNGVGWYKKPQNQEVKEQKEINPDIFSIQSGSNYRIQSNFVDLTNDQEAQDKNKQNNHSQKADNQISNQKDSVQTKQFPNPVDEEEELGGEYQGIDISSLNRSSGVRKYFKVLYQGYVDGGVTMAETALEKENEKARAKLQSDDEYQNYSSE